MARVIKIDNAVLKRRQYKNPKREEKQIVCRILIVCEGEKTEPNYFKSFPKIKQGSVVYDIETEGTGKDTIGVVDQAIKMKNEASIPFDSVWAVFDKDDFLIDRFNGAITKARNNGINCAWSNEAFELWYLLHFHNRVTAMCRDEYRKAISDAVNNSPKNQSKKKEYVYAKNDGNNYRIMNLYGNQDDAIKWAKDLHEKCNDGKYHTHNPCTVVYKLVLQLTGQDEELNEMVSAMIDK